MDVDLEPLAQNEPLPPPLPDQDQWGVFNDPNLYFCVQYSVLLLCVQLLCRVLGVDYTTESKVVLVVSFAVFVAMTHLTFFNGP